MYHAAFTIREVSSTPYRTAHSTHRFFPFVAAPGASTGQDNAPEPKPTRDVDAIEQLGDEIAKLSAQIHAANYRLLELIAQFDRRGGWEVDGQRSCAHWLAFRTGIDIGAAREKVRAAHALEHLPLTSGAMARGELSFSQVRALTRVAEPANESALLELARGSTTEQLERMVRAWKKGTCADEAAAERERRESRCVSVFPGDDGMYVIRGRLRPEVGALLMRAIEAAGDALFAERNSGVSTDTEREAAQRRADALGLIAERSLAAGFSASDPDVPVSGTGAQRYQVVLHVEPSTLATDGESGRSELEDGTRVSAETSRRLTCDGSVVRVTQDARGSVLDVARRTRTIPPALRRALEIRDRGCRFPGCGLRFTDAHHVRHWADGGHTSLANCLLLCSHHHTLVHEGGWRVEWWGELPTFIDPRGNMHCEAGWRAPQLERPVDALIEENKRRGAEPDAWTASARWQRERDIPADIYNQASEAI